MPPADVPWTWERAHEQQNSDLGYAHGVMLAALRDVRMGESESAEQLLNHEVGESSAKEEDEDENMEESD